MKLFKTIFLFLGFLLSVSELYAMDLYIKDKNILWQSEKNNWKEEGWIKVEDPILIDKIKKAKEVRVIDGKIVVNDYTTSEINHNKLEKLKETLLLLRQKYSACEKVEQTDMVDYHNEKEKLKNDINEIKEKINSF